MSPSAEAKVRLLLFLFCSKNSFSPCGFLPAGMRRFFPSCVLTAWVKKKGNTEHLRTRCCRQLWISPRHAPLSQQVSMSQLSTAMMFLLNCTLIESFLMWARVTGYIQECVRESADLELEGTLETTQGPHILKFAKGSPNI